MKKILFILLGFVLATINVLAQQARNSSGSENPEQPSTIYIGDIGTFGHDSWGKYNEKEGQWKVVIHTSDKIGEGIFGDFTGYSNTEHKTANSPRFTSTGTWYWGMQVNYDGTYKWYCRNDVNWHNMWDEPTSDLTITVSALPNPTNLSAAAASSSSIDLSWTKSNDKNVMIVRKPSSDSWTEPTQGTAYSIGNSIGSGVVVHNDAGTSFTDTDLLPNTSYDYKFYSENWSYYSAGAISAGIITENSTSSDNFRSKATGNWNVAGNWESSPNNNDWVTSSLIPDAQAASITILSGHTITLDENVTISTLTISSGATFIASDATARTLIISNGGSLANNGTFTAGSGKVSFAGAGTVSGTVAFNDVDIAGGVNFGNNSSINGTLTVKPNGYVDTKAITYNSDSILKFESDYDINTGSKLWFSNTASSGSAQKGIPWNVEIASGKNVQLNDSYPFSMNGSLLINGTFRLGTANGSDGDLNLRGDFENNGIFNHNSRALDFKGAFPHEIKGTATTTFAYLNVSSGADVAVNNSKSVTINNGLFIYGDGNFTIKSDASGTGSLIINGHIIDNVTVERYMSGTETWRLVSSPVVAQTIIDVNNWTPTGTYENGHGYDFYAYDEATAFWLNQKDGANSITTFTPGKGYLVSFQAADQTKTFTGKLNTGDVPIGITKGGSGDYAGASLIGNPYPSGIDWNQADRSLFNDEYAYVYDRVSSEGETYEGYALVNGAAASAFIAPHQGFFVIKKDAGSSNFTFTNAMRSHGGTFTKSPTTLERLKLKVSNGSYYDLATIQLNENASFDRDRMDAIKFYSNNSSMPNFYTVSKDGKQLSINSIPEVDLEEPIILGVTIPENGNYVISLNEQGAAFSDKVLFLEDLHTGARQDLTNDGSYSFTSSSTDSPDRFLLHFGVVGIGEQDQATTLHAYTYNNRLYVNNSLEQAQIAVYDLQGRLLMQQSASTSGLQSLPLDLPAGVYVVRLSNAQEAKSVKINVQ